MANGEYAKDGWKKGSSSAAGIKQIWSGRKTFGLLLQVQKQYFPTGRYSILDPDFCPLKRIIELKKEGSQAAILLAISCSLQINLLHIQSKTVLEMDVVSWILSGVKYFILGVKESNYVVKIMEICGISVSDGCKEACKN